MALSSTTTQPEINGLRLGKQKMTALVAKAKRLGLSPARYVKQLVEEDLAIDADAQSLTLAEIMAPVREEFRESGMTEEELEVIVDVARKRQNRRPPGRN